MISNPPGRLTAGRLTGFKFPGTPDGGQIYPPSGISVQSRKKMKVL